MFKKVLVAVTAMVMMAVGVLADTATVNGITWTYTVSDGKASISDVPETTTGAINIPSSLGGYPVTSIGDGAFDDCSGLTSVTIPNSVTSIGDGAFFSCDGLMSVTIPNSVTSIGDWAFRGCSGLTSVVIPNSVTSIGGSAFYNCGLTSVTIPDSVTSIGEWAFGECDDLTSVTIPDSVTSIGGSAFSGCHDSLFDTTTIPGVKLVDGWVVGYTASCPSVLDLTGVRGIGCSAFRGCSGLTSVTIPDSVTSIGNSAFYDCDGLTSVTIPNSVTSIGESAFGACSGLMSVTIGNSVTSIGNSAFSWCSGLTKFIVDSNNPNYKSVNGFLLSKDGKVLIKGVNGDVVIPQGVTSIGNYAFSECSGLTSVTIPDSVTSIGNKAFYDCDGLTSVTIPNSVKSIGEWAFWDCDGLTSVVIPQGVTSIGGSAFFGCSVLTSVTIPQGVTSIGYWAFYECDDLKSAIFLGDAPRNAGNAIFDNCADDFTIKVKKGTKGWNGDYNSTALPATWRGYPIEVYGSLLNASVSSSIAILSTMYDGTAKTNSLTIEYNGHTLINGLDFELSYLNNIDAGVASVIATGIGNFTDCITNTFIITKRKVTLTSASDSKVYDGTALKGESVTVGGDGFANGEGATYTFTGSQTDVGTSENGFTYTLNGNTKAGNYDVTTANGTLTVLLPPTVELKIDLSKTEKGKGEWGNVRLLTNSIPLKAAVAGTITSYTINVGANVDLTFVPNEGFRIYGSQAGNSAFTSITNYTFTAMTNSTYSATFQPAPKTSLAWKYAKNKNGWFCAQISLPGYAGYSEAFENPRFLFADRVNSQNVRTSYLVDPSTVIDPLGTTEVYGNTTYRKVALPVSAFAGKVNGTRVVFGVSDATMASSVDSVPAGERTIALRVVNRNINSVELLDNVIGYFAWDCCGETFYQPLGGKQSPGVILRKPLSIRTLNNAAAFGIDASAVAPEYVNCRFASFNIANGKFIGTFEVVAESDEGTKAAVQEITSSVSTLLLGSESPAGPFEAIGDEVKDITFDVDNAPFTFQGTLPQKYKFFRLNLNIEEIYK